MRKEELYIVTNLNKRLRRLLDQFDGLNERYARLQEGKSSSPVPGSVRGSMISDQTGNYASEITDLPQEIEETRQEIKETEARIQTERKKLETAFYKHDYPLNEILCLTYINNLSYRQIGDELGISKSCVHEQIKRFLEQIEREG